MNGKDIALGFFVVITWGLNFVIIKLALVGMPPFLLATLRFSMVAIPAIFFIARPNVPLKWLALYGLTMSFGQFAFLFSAINIGMPAGVASLVIQSQVFFTVLLSMVFFREKLLTKQLVGILIAITGMGLLFYSAAGGDEALPGLGFMLTIGAAISWAVGNISVKLITRRNPSVNMMSLVVWGSLIPILPFSLFSWVFEGKTLIAHSLANIQFGTVLAILYLAIFATLIGYAIWGGLLARYESWRVVPLALLVPIIGLISASIILHEELSTLQIIGGAVTLVGLMVNVLGTSVLKPLKFLQLK